MHLIDVKPIESNKKRMSFKGTKDFEVAKLTIKQIKTMHALSSIKIIFSKDRKIIISKKILKVIN